MISDLEKYPFENENRLLFDLRYRIPPERASDTFDERLNRQENAGPALFVTSMFFFFRPVHGHLDVCCPWNGEH